LGLASSVQQPKITQPLLQTLLRKDAVQTMLQDEDFQNLVCGVYRMNKAGRSYILKDAGNKVNPHYPLLLTTLAAYIFICERTHNSV
jgi:hypothetical protein